MPVEEGLDRLVVVLVRARNPLNIGAVARAMHDFGFQHLRVVNEFAVPFREARAAVDASDVLAAAGEFGSLAEAVADCTLVVGTTAVGARVLDHPLHLLPEAARMIRPEMGRAGGRVALVLGSEKTGLSNEELSYCRWLLTIPMRVRGAGERHVSMNLGQAAAVCLYELGRVEGLIPSEGEERATGEDLERLTGLLGEVLERTGYRRRHPANCGAEAVRRLVRRMVMGKKDAGVWMGVWRQVLWALKGGGSLSE